MATCHFWRLRFGDSTLCGSILAIQFQWLTFGDLIQSLSFGLQCREVMHLESRGLSSNIASNHPQLPSSSSLSSSSSSSSLSASTSSLSPQRTEVRRTIWSHQVNLTQKIIKLMLQVQNLTAEGEQQGPFHLRLFLWWGFLCQCLLSACIHDTANHQNVAGSKSRSRGLTGGALPSSTVFVVRFFGVSRRCLI